MERLFRERLGRNVLYLPSARLALYIAFREWLRPGDRLLMSSVTDDVVLFTVLAAGLVPVLAPVSPATGNMDLAAIDEGTWSRIRGVMTTNLYGMPDQMDRLENECRRRNLVLLEDASHALDSWFGERRIGQFGVAAVYSLSKHLESKGGILAFSEEQRRESLARRAAEELRPRTFGSGARRVARSILDLTRTRDLARRVVLRLEISERRGKDRMPYETRDVVGAGAAGGGLDRFDRWVRVDDREYRVATTASSLETALRRMKNFQANREARLEGARKLLPLGLTPPAYMGLSDTPLLRVPLLVAERERVRAELGRRGFAFQYIYDPPLDIYGDPAFVERLPRTPGAKLWSRHVLPANPLLADRLLELLHKTPSIKLARPPAACS
jgi:hypothetical protein